MGDCICYTIVLVTIATHNTSTHYTSVVVYNFSKQKNKHVVVWTVYLYNQLCIAVTFNFQRKI